jgi:glycosyltransferase involved in cell wall biosynthesis
MIDILSALELDYKWVHFGWGEGAEEVVELANQKLKSGSFDFRGLTPNAEILRYYRENPVDLVINVSELEGIPVSLMEAISSGIPVAGCNVCGVPELVCDETGILLPANPEPEITAVLLKQFLTERSRNAKFRQGIKTFWSAHFNAEKNYKMFIERALN